ncbi:condensin complex subunit, putative [Phytophthora infestans T30-4]|uniref:Condensin complex subunit, putative n=1 Tax=Phytophthora infestans (strain T30-4) TaxID=403677 RepID=D0P2X5_PHYIT|nr:condensin complex subunit, putative [Phytophthora infestans T30-4]EEY58497.1 condensin complex subunit, putative [Phytophthora infestans T30-4]|eukprot:XP_002895348.1 condensin complex subunit, putative [Phytophthora infestans T30-4]
MEFLVPLHAADLELAKAGRYHVQSVMTFEDEAMAEISARIQRLEDQVLGSEAGLELLQEDWLDLTYSLVKKLPTLSESLRMRVVEMLAAFVSNVTEGVLARRPGSEDADDVVLYRSAFKASVYFLITALTSVSSLQVQAEKDIIKHKGKGKSQNLTINRVNWSKVMEGAIHKLSRSVSPKTFAMWNMNVPEEEFSMLYCKVVFELLGNATLCRGKSLKPKLFHLLAMSLQKAPAIHISVVASLIDLIYTHEHLSASIAELVELLYFKYANMTFAADLISEIGKISSRDASKDVAGTRNIAMFLSSLSTRTPALIMGNLSFVLALLDSEAYQLRNAAVTCVTQILLWSFRQSGQHQDPEEPEAATKFKQKTREQKEKKDQESKNDDLDTGDSSEDDEGSSSDSNDGQEEEEEAGKANEDAPRTFSRSTRDQLLSVLEDRTHDVNSFARGHVLKMWALLCEEGALPLHMLKNVTLMAVGRLQDKAAVVRRHSIHLLSLLLERNPFMGNLDRAFYEKKRGELAQKMKKKRDEVIAGAEKEMSEAMGDIAIQSEAAAATCTSSQPAVSSEEQAAALEKDLQTMVRLLQFYQDAIDFIDEFELQALPLMGQLLGSKSISDVLEAIQFFEKAYRFHLGAAQTGIRKVLPLTWRSDVSIQEQLSNTFVGLFIRIDVDDPERNSPQLVAENLVKFLDECTVAEYTCLERIMGELHGSQKVPMVVISALWGLVDVAVYPISVVSNALVLLSMIANIDDSMLFSNDRLGQVLSMGLGELACSPDSQYRVLGAACRLVQCIQLEPKAATAKCNSQTQRRIQRSNLDATEQIILRLQRFLALDFVSDDGIALECLHSTWFDTVQQAIEAIFSICERPEEVCGDVIKHLSLRLFESETDDVSRVELAHFFFVLGHSAVKVAIHVEKLAAKVKKMRGNRSAAARPADNSGSNDGEDVSAMEDELGVAAEVEAEEDTFVHNIIQKEIACRNLLGVYGPLIIRVLVGKEEELRGDKLLTECAVVALSKFMAVSEEFCEKHLQLLFTILQDSPQPSVRGDVIIALGDLSFRFPNLVEPWTSHLYNRLRDVNLNVRKNTIVVLSHLILNDMIKVKGQISEIAISLVDENDGIRSLAKLFFFELSKKGNNPIYNMLPDAIGQLSTSELVSNSDFQTISRFLIQFITKEKQIESIVEKLSQRFPTASKMQQQRDLAYCLARLAHTEKSLKYLYQNRKLYSDALHDNSVADTFTALVAKARRGNSALTATAEMKEAIDKLDQFVVETKEGKEGDETMDGGESTERAPSPVAKGKAKQRAKRKTRKPKATRVVSEEEDSSEEE